MGSFYPALDIKPPESPLQQYAQVQQIRAGQQQQQLTGLQIQQQQLAMKDQQAMTAAMRQWDGKDYNDLPSLVLKNGGSANALFATGQHILDIRAKTSDIAAKDAATNASNLDTLIKQNDRHRGTLQSIIAMTDPAQKQAQWDAEVTKEEQAGTIQPGQISHTYPGDDQATFFANNLALGSQIAKETTEKMSATGTLLRGQAAAALVPSEQAKNVAQTNLAITQQQQAGQVTPKDTFEAQQANYRAALSRQAELTNSIGRQGLENLQKQGDDYQKYLRQGQAVKTAVQAAQDGNQMAAALAPLGAAVFEMKANGDIARVNPQVFADIQGAGSIVQRINGTIGKALGGGPLSDQLKNDLVTLFDKYTDAKYQSYVKMADYVQKLHGLDPTKIPVLGRNGETTVIADAKTQSQNLPSRTAGQIPAGATMKVPGSDGKMHWSDGKRDLGVAQ